MTVTDSDQIWGILLILGLLRIYCSGKYTQTKNYHLNWTLNSHGLISFVCFLLQHIAVIHWWLHFNASWDSGLACAFKKNMRTMFRLQMLKFLLHKVWFGFYLCRWETSWNRKYLPALSCSCHRGGWEVSCTCLLALTAFSPPHCISAPTPIAKLPIFSCNTLSPDICQLHASLVWTQKTAVLEQIRAKVIECLWSISVCHS